MNVEIKVEQDTVDVSTNGGPAYDPAWRFTDDAGHVHEGSALERTLEWVVTSTYWCHDCHDEHEEGEYHCRFCGVVVEPGTVWKPAERREIPGLTRYTLIVIEPPFKRTYMLTRAEFEAMPPRRVDEGVGGGAGLKAALQPRFTPEMEAWIRSVQARGAELEDIAS